MNPEAVFLVIACLVAAILVAAAGWVVVPTDGWHRVEPSVVVTGRTVNDQPTVLECSACGPLGVLGEGADEAGIARDHLTRLHPDA